MGETVAQTQPQDERPQDKARFVCRGLHGPVHSARRFAVWGSAANLTDVMVGVFRPIFVVSNARSALLQTAYYGAYFTLAIPASFINRRFGYKTGVLTGLGVAAVGTQKPQGVWDQRLPRRGKWALLVSTEPDILTGKRKRRYRGRRPPDGYECRS